MNDYEWYITPESYSIAEQNGISRGTLENRIRDLGWGTKKATTTPVQLNTDYGQWPEIARKNGIKTKTFYSRAKKMGPELAATTPIKDRAEIMKAMTEIRRIHPQKYLDLAKENGITRFTFRERVKRGWSYEDAATRPLMSKKEASALAERKPYIFGRGMKCRHQWDVSQRSKRCVICGYKDKAYGEKMRLKERGYAK